MTVWALNRLANGSVTGVDAMAHIWEGCVLAAMHMYICMHVHATHTRRCTAWGKGPNPQPKIKNRKDKK